jgi:glycosyltransferase involved in cell wall biosynthesis
LSKIVHISTGHHRNEIRVHLKQCNSLAAAGHDVFFLLADGRGDERIGNVSVLDVGLPQGRFERMLVWPWLMLRKARGLQAAAFHFHDPELLLIALFLKRSGARVIYDSHEDTPRSLLSREWIPQWARRLVSGVLEVFENFVARRLSAVVGATPFIAERFERVGCRSVAINNFPLPAEISVDAVSYPQRADICFLGSIGLVRGLKQIIMALEPLHTRLVLAGPFDRESTRHELERLPGWHRVDYRGNLERHAAVSTMMNASVGMLCYLPEPNHVNAYPNKLFEYMAAGLPVIASNFPLWRSIVEGADCGICVDPTDPVDIRKAIARLIDDPLECRRLGENGRKAVMRQYNWQSEEAKLVSLYSELLK